MQGFKDPPLEFKGIGIGKRGMSAGCFEDTINIIEPLSVVDERITRPILGCVTQEMP